jgi:Zn finger protein HypA/HybF involved in hydrogenase expression
MKISVRLDVNYEYLLFACEDCKNWANVTILGFKRVVSELRVTCPKCNSSRVVKLAHSLPGEGS